MQPTMKALTITGPNAVELVSITVPVPAPGEVQVRTALVGVCGTDSHLLSGHSFYLESGLVRYPFVFGHEYTGTVSAVGSGVTAIGVGDRVVGHTMVPCHHCDNCQKAAPTMCRNLREVGLRHIPGAAAEFVTVPEFAVTVLPDSVSFEAAVLVEPSVAAYRALAELSLRPTDRVAVIGTGTLGLLAMLFARLIAARVDVISINDSEMEFARELGAAHAFRPGDAPTGFYTAVIEASGASSALATAVDAIDLGGRIALIGLSSSTSPVDQSALVLKSATVIGVLHGLDYYEDVVALFASGALDPRPLIARVVSPLDALSVLGGAGHDRTGRRAPKSLISFG